MSQYQLALPKNLQRIFVATLVKVIYVLNLDQMLQLSKLFSCC